MCEEKESSEMLRIGGGLWEGGLEAVEKGVPQISREEEEMEEEEWEKEVVCTFESLKHVKVDDGSVRLLPPWYKAVLRYITRTGHLRIMPSMFRNCISFSIKLDHCSRCLLKVSRLGPTFVQRPSK